MDGVSVGTLSSSLRSFVWTSGAWVSANRAHVVAVLSSPIHQTERYGMGGLESLPCGFVTCHQELFGDEISITGSLELSTRTLTVGTSIVVITLLDRM